MIFRKNKCGLIVASEKMPADNHPHQVNDTRHGDAIEPAKDKCDAEDVWSGNAAVHGVDKPKPVRAETHVTSNSQSRKYSKASLTSKGEAVPRAGYLSATENKGG